MAVMRSFAVTRLDPAYQSVRLRKGAGSRGAASEMPGPTAGGERAMTEKIRIIPIDPAEQCTRFRCRITAIGWLLPKRVLRFCSACLLLFAIAVPGPANAVLKETRVLMSNDVEKIQAYFSGHTIRFFAASNYGNQIEYYGTDSVAHLWFWGNRGVARSKWKIEKTGSRARICFLYPSRSYNPMTRQFGGKWECRSPGNYHSLIRERIRGDLRIVAWRQSTVRPAALPASDVEGLEKPLMEEAFLRLLKSMKSNS